MSLLAILDLFGVAVFAISGSLLAREGRRFDLFGVIVVALVTALGGGTLRDAVLGRTPVFWIDDNLPIIVGIVAALVTYWLTHRRAGPTRLFNRLLIVSDAFGLALFTVIGVQVALDSGIGAFSAVLMGLMTGTAGGVIRDVLYNRVPLILQREIYATASLAGGTVYVALTAAALDPTLTTIITIAVTLGLRLIAIRRRWSLPVFEAGAAIGYAHPDDGE